MECMVSCNTLEKKNNQIAGNGIEKEIFKHVKWEIKTINPKDESKEFSNSKLKKEENDEDNFETTFANTNFDNKTLNSRKTIYFDEDCKIKINEEMMVIYPNSYYKITEGKILDNKKKNNLSEVNINNKKESIYAFAFSQDEEQNFYELIDGAISGLKNEPDRKIILLVTSKSSIDWGRAVLQIDSAVKPRVRFCVLPECAVFYDIEGNVVDDSNGKESEDTGKTITSPKEEMPGGDNASDEAPKTIKAVTKDNTRDSSELPAPETADSKDLSNNGVEGVRPESKEMPIDGSMQSQSEDVSVN